MLTILWIDDELSRLEFHIKALEEIASVIPATAKEAFQFLKEQDEKFDVIITDIMMDLEEIQDFSSEDIYKDFNLGGIILLKSLPDEILKNKKIVIFSNIQLKNINNYEEFSKNYPDIKKCIEDGTIRYIEKPIRPSSLRNIVSKMTTYTGNKED